MQTLVENAHACHTNIHALEEHPCVVNLDILQSRDIKESMMPIAKADPELQARSPKVIDPMSSLLAGTPDTAQFTSLDAGVNWKEDTHSLQRVMHECMSALRALSWEESNTWGSPWSVSLSSSANMALWKPIPEAMDLKII